MRRPLRFLALVAWGAFLMFIGQQAGIWGGRELDTGSLADIIWRGT